MQLGKARCDPAAGLGWRLHVSLGAERPGVSRGECPDGLAGKAGSGCYTGLIHTSFWCVAGSLLKMGGQASEPLSVVRRDMCALKRAIFHGNHSLHARLAPVLNVTLSSKGGLEDPKRSSKIDKTRGGAAWSELGGRLFLGQRRPGRGERTQGGQHPQGWKWTGVPIPRISEKAAMYMPREAELLGIHQHPHHNAS